MGALELRRGAIPPSLSLAAPDMVQALSVEQLFDSVAIRVDGPRAAAERLSIDWTFTDLGQTVRTQLGNGVLVQTVGGSGAATAADVTVTLTKPQLLGLLAGQQPADLEMAGDAAVLGRLFGVLDAVDPGFDIVTP